MASDRLTDSAGVPISVGDILVSSQSPNGRFVEVVEIRGGVARLRRRPESDSWLINREALRSSFWVKKLADHDMPTDPERAALAAMDELESLAGLAGYSQRYEDLLYEHAPALFSLARRAEINPSRDPESPGWMDTEVSGTPCVECGHECIEFSRPSEEWNATMRPDGRETGREYLCAPCYMNHLARRAERAERAEGEIAACHNVIRAHGLVGEVESERARLARAALSPATKGANDEC